MAIKIIGAGFGRTGTHSLKLALEELGFGRCYHMEDLIMDHPEAVAFWQDLKADKPVDWDEFFEGYQSAVDFPTNVLYKKFIQQYPDAKIILTVRDPESWYRSFGNTIIKSARPSLNQKIQMSIRLPFNRKLRQRLKVLRFAGNFLKEFLPGDFADKETSIRFFQRWNEDIQETIPPDKLLVYNLKEGWEPLCKFLGVAVPDKPMPHSNTTSDFLNRKLWKDEM